MSNYIYSNDHAIMRNVVRRSWNIAQAKESINGYNRVITPFRAVKNAGDYLARQNAWCGGPSTPGGNFAPGRKGRNTMFTGVCDATGVPVSHANQKFVYDSSDYTRYKKEAAINSFYKKQLESR